MGSTCRRIPYLLALVLEGLLPAQVQWQRVDTDSDPVNQFTAFTSPPSMVQHRADGILYLFARIPGPYLYAWTGTGWHFLAESRFPGPIRPSVAYDPASEGILAFGDMSGHPANETWSWDGVRWRRHFPASSPSPRKAAALVEDLARGRVILFGGIAEGGPTRDTWEWDGTDWVQRFPATVPPPLESPAIAYDSVRERVVMHGGMVDGDHVHETWEWDGEDWSLVATATPPRGPMAFDSSRGRMVLQVSTRTWEYDGASWFERASQEPVEVRGYVMGYDEEGRRILLLRPAAGSFLPPPETWSYGPLYPAEYETFGEGCQSRGRTPRLTASSLPWAGDDLVLELTSLPAFAVVLGLTGLSRESFLGLPLPADLRLLGRRDCDLLVRPDFLSIRFAHESTASWALKIPGDPGLLGLEFFNQALVLSLGRLSVTNAGAGRIGGR